MQKEAPSTAAPPKLAQCCCCCRRRFESALRGLKKKSLWLPPPLAPPPPRLRSPSSGRLLSRRLRPRGDYSRRQSECVAKKKMILNYE
jgi:hypothetical protein